MSIVLESGGNDHRNGGSGFVHGMRYATIYDSTGVGRFRANERRYSATVKECDDDSGSESSSIGRNSDDSSPDRSSDDDDDEVKSELKGGALDFMDALEEVLPVKKSISNFYQGKSKSFTTLTDAASCSSIKEIVKPEDAYSKRRKNVRAYINFRDKSRNLPPRNNSGGISKRLANYRSALALAVAMSSSDNSSDENSSTTRSLVVPTLCLPPLPSHGRKSPDKKPSSSPPKKNFTTWRSFSLSDLQCATVAAASTTIAGSHE